MKKSTIGIILILFLLAVSVTAYIILPNQIISTFGSGQNTVQTTSKLSAIGISAGVGILGAVIYIFNRSTRPAEEYKPLVLYSISIIIVVTLTMLNLGVIK